jgi:outer membrane protein assembly factor BamA
MEKNNLDFPTPKELKELSKIRRETLIQVELERIEQAVKKAATELGQFTADVKIEYEENKRFLVKKGFRVNLLLDGDYTVRWDHIL